MKNPLTLLRESEHEMQSIPKERLFNDSRYRKVLEKWCAAIFGLGYEEHIKECAIEMVDEENDSADFYLAVNGKKYPFQLTEAQKEERRRGKEYKERDGNFLLMEPYHPEAGSIKGPKWILESVKKKVDKKYSSSRELNLLVYANFDANNFARDRIKKELSGVAESFASIWIMTNHQLCSIFGNPEVGEMDGWGIISLIYPLSNKMRSKVTRSSST